MCLPVRTTSELLHIFTFDVFPQDFEQNLGLIRLYYLRRHLFSSCWQTLEFEWRHQCDRREWRGHMFHKFRPLTPLRCAATTVSCPRLSMPGLSLWCKRWLGATIWLQGGESVKNIFIRKLAMVGFLSSWYGENGVSWNLHKMESHAAQGRHHIPGPPEWLFQDYDSFV